MINQPITLSPTEVKILVQCPLHYHFLDQETPPAALETDEAIFQQRVLKAIRRLHAAGRPTRYSLAACLKQLKNRPVAQRMIEHYYPRLKRAWPQVLAAHETMELKITLGNRLVLLSGTIDRLDKAEDGGIIAILFRLETAPVPTPEVLAVNPATTIYHALVAANYSHRRPIRIQELWLRSDQVVEVELSETVYRQNLGQLREPIQALSRGEVMARPGLHCDMCPFKYHGCPVYPQKQADSDEDFTNPPSDGKMLPRKWIFKI